MRQAEAQIGYVGDPALVVIASEHVNVVPLFHECSTVRLEFVVLGAKNFTYVNASRR